MDDLEKRKMSAKVDTKEFELPETIYSRDIENQVFQNIVLQCLMKIDGIALVEKNFINNLLGRSPATNTNSIYIEQDSKAPSVSVKVEVNCSYGLSIPEKAEEIQFKIADAITKATGLHVSSVHVVFKDILDKESLQRMKKGQKEHQDTQKEATITAHHEEDYTDEF